MSDRINGFIVVLDESYKDDYIENTINAIKQIKGVIKVTPHIQGIESTIATAQVKRKLIDKIYKILEE